MCNYFLFADKKIGIVGCVCVRAWEWGGHKAFLDICPKSLFFFSFAWKLKFAN